MKLTRDFLKKLILEQMGNTPPIDSSFSYGQEGSVGEMGYSGPFQEAYEILANPSGPAQFAYITAYNPPYKMKSGGEWDNERQQNMLLQELAGYDYIIGDGQYMGDSEQTIMVFSNNPKIQDKFKNHMVMLGKRYLQDAIVYAEKWSGMTIDASKGEYPITPDGERLPAPSGVQGEQGPRYFWYLEMLDLMPTKTEQPSSLGDWNQSKLSTYVLSNPSIQSRGDDFTVVKGRKYYIPFYEDYPEEMIHNASPVR